MKYKIAAVCLVIIGAVVTFVFPWAMGGLLQDSSRDPLTSGALNDVTINGQVLPFSQIGDPLDGISNYLTYSGNFEGIMLWLILIGIAILLFNKKEK